MKAHLFAILMAVNATFITACNAEPKNHTAPKQEILMNQSAIVLQINNQTFDLQLENNETATAFANLLPLDLAMDDHLNNEKFATLPKSLPTNDQKIGRIQIGDVLLWQGDTVVIFYESFDSNYRYTKIGKIRQTDDLKNALGRGTAQVKWGNP